MGTVAIPAQYGWRIDHWFLRNGCDRGLLRAVEKTGRVWSLILRVGIIVAAIACMLQIFPTGDQQGQLVTQHQPITLAAMEGLFETERSAAIVLIGQPDTDNLKLDNPIYIPKVLSFLTQALGGRSEGSKRISA